MSIYMIVVDILGVLALAGYAFAVAGICTDWFGPSRDRIARARRRCEELESVLALNSLPGASKHSPADPPGLMASRREQLQCWQARYDDACGRLADLLTDGQIELV